MVRYSHKGNKMATSIKITALTDIAGNLAFDTIIPVVNMTGTPVTEKANLQIVGNLFLSGAGGANFVAAARATTAGTVTTAAQANITSVGTLTSLSVSGEATANSIAVTNGAANPTAATDTTIAFKLPITINGNTYYVALTEAV
jgi:hypothetical protein